MPVGIAALDPAGLPDPAGAQQTGGDVVKLALRAEHQPIDPGIDGERRRWRRWRAARRILDQMAGIDPRGMDIGVPAPLGPAGNRAADIALANDKAADLDPVDMLVVVAEQRREPAVEPGRRDLDLRDPGDLLIVEIEDERCRSRLIGRLFPAGLGDREGGATQIEQRRRLASVARRTPYR